MKALITQRTFVRLGDTYPIEVPDGYTILRIEPSREVVRVWYVDTNDHEQRITALERVAHEPQPIVTRAVFESHTHYQYGVGVQSGKPEATA